MLTAGCCIEFLDEKINEVICFLVEKFSLVEGM